MSQMQLFAAEPLCLVDDAEGGVRYLPDFVPRTTAEDWFADLRHEVAWRHERRLMYERELDVPRLSATYGLGPERAMPAALRDAARLVRHALAIDFNSAGLNLYRNGRDSVAPHNDRLQELMPAMPIALLSLGATRRMTIRAKQAPRHAIHLDLEPASLLVMSHASQLHYVHGIAKTETPCGTRISIAFRVRPAD